MKNEELRKYLQYNYKDSVIFNDPEIDKSIVGVSSDNRIVYDADKIVDELTIDRGLSIDEVFTILNNLILSIDKITIGHPPLIVDFKLKYMYNDFI